MQTLPNEPVAVSHMQELDVSLSKGTRLDLSEPNMHSFMEKFLQNLSDVRKKIPHQGAGEWKQSPSPRAFLGGAAEWLEKPQFFVRFLVSEIHLAQTAAGRWECWPSDHPPTK